MLRPYDYYNQVLANKEYPREYLLEYAERPMLDYAKNLIMMYSSLFENNPKIVDKLTDLTKEILFDPSDRLVDVLKEAFNRNYRQYENIEELHKGIKIIDDFKKLVKLSKDLTYSEEKARLEDRRLYSSLYNKHGEDFELIIKIADYQLLVNYFESNPEDIQVSIRNLNLFLELSKKYGYSLPFALLLYLSKDPEPLLGHIYGDHVVGATQYFGDYRKNITEINDYIISDKYRALGYWILLPYIQNFYAELPQNNIRIKRTPILTLFEKALRAKMTLDTFVGYVVYDVGSISVLDKLYIFDRPMLELMRAELKKVSKPPKILYRGKYAGTDSKPSRGKRSVVDIDAFLGGMGFGKYYESDIYMICNDPNSFLIPTDRGRTGQIVTDEDGNRVLDYNRDFLPDSPQRNYYTLCDLKNRNNQGNMMLFYRVLLDLVERVIKSLK